MAAKGNEGLMEEVKLMLRSVLLSSKGGVDENFLLKEYRELTGDPLPYRQLGFNSLYDLAMRMRDVVSVARMPDGSIKFQAVADASTAHIQKMVSRQRSARPKKKGFSKMRKPVRQSNWVRNAYVRPSVFSHNTPSYRPRSGRRSPPGRRSPSTYVPAPAWKSSAGSQRNFQPPRWKSPEIKVIIPKLDPQAASAQMTLVRNEVPFLQGESWDVDSPPKSTFNRSSSQSPKVDSLDFKVTTTPGGTRHVTPPLAKQSHVTSTPTKQNHVTPAPTKQFRPSLPDNRKTFQEDMPPRFQPVPVVFSPIQMYPYRVTTYTAPSPVAAPRPIVGTPISTPKTAVEPALSTTKSRTPYTPLQDARKKDSLDYVKLLQDYMRVNNIEEEFMTVPPGRGPKGRARGFVSSITINGQYYGSLGIFSTKERAEYFAAKTAWEGLTARRASAESSRTLSSSADEAEVKRNVMELLNEKPNGIFEQMVAEEYCRKFQSNPPRNLMDFLVKWKDVATVEEVVTLGKRIVYPSKQKYKTTEKKSEEKRPDHIPEAEMPATGYTAIAVICFVIDLDTFFIHLTRETMINEIMGKMEDLYVKKVKGEPPRFSHTKKLESMKYCAALYDGRWYRAQALTDPIPNRNFEDEVEILYVDFGNTERQLLESTRPLSRSMYSYPAQAIRCSLYGVRKKDDDSWDTATLNLNLLEQESTAVAVTIKGVQDDVCQVDLYNKPNNKGQSINEMLIRSKLVRDALTVRAKEPGPLVIPDVPVGETLDVFVSHVYTASNIIIRLLCNSDQLSELEKLIKENNLPTGQDDIEVNDLCAAFDKESLEEDSDDNPWFRVRIIEILDKEKAKIEYLDYGGTSEMELRSLRLLTVEENQLPYQALQVRLTALEGCEVEAITEELKSSCELRPYVAEINSRDPVSVTLWDTSKAEDVNVNEYILQILNEDELRPRVPPLMGDAECFAVHVTPAGTVFVHMKGPGMQKLDKLIKEATETIARTEDSLSLESLEPNTVCLVLFSDQWYRGRIAEVHPDDRVKVSLVDYGNETEVSHGDLLDLDKFNTQLSRLPHQAVEVCLDGTPSLWTEKALVTLEELVHEQQLYIETIQEGTEDSLPSVELYTIQDGELYSVRESLMADKSIWEDTKDLFSGGDCHDVNDLLHEMKLEDGANSDIVNNNSATKEEIANYIPRLPEEVGNMQFNSTNEHQEDDLPKNRRDLPQSGDRIIVTSAASPSNFQFIAEKDRAGFDYLMMRMTEYYRDKVDFGSDLETVDKGDMVAAYNMDDACIYRAEVKKMLPADQLSVFLPDLGDYHVVDRNHIFSLMPEFTEIPPYAMCATLIGISPTQGQIWSMAATQRFEELVYKKTLVVWAPQPVAWVGHQVALTLLTEKNSTDEAETFIHQTLLTSGLAMKSLSRRNSASSVD